MCASFHIKLNYVSVYEYDLAIEYIYVWTICTTIRYGLFMSLFSTKPNQPTQPCGGHNNIYLFPQNIPQSEITGVFV